MTTVLAAIWTAIGRIRVRRAALIVLLSGAVMTAPEGDETRLALLGKLAELAGRESGAGAMGQASAASVVRNCMSATPFVQGGASTSGDQLDRLCGLIARLQRSINVVDYAVAKYAVLDIQNTPTIVCFGAFHLVKCVSFGNGSSFFADRPAATGNASGLSMQCRGIPRAWNCIPKALSLDPTFSDARSQLTRLEVKP